MGSVTALSVLWMVLAVGDRGAVVYGDEELTNDCVFSSWYPLD